MGASQTIRTAYPFVYSSDWEKIARSRSRDSRRASALWMILDAVTVVVAVTLATLAELHTGLFQGVRGFWHGTLIQGRPMWILTTMLCGFMVALIGTSRGMNLYTPSQLNGFAHEQRLTFQASFISGLLLTGALYLLRASDIPRTIVMITLTLVTASLSVRRFAYRVWMYRQLERGIGVRNLLIVGTGPEAQALRHHVEKIRHLGFSFKGFIAFPHEAPPSAFISRDVVGSLNTLFDCARKNFVDEIIVAGTCDPAVIHGVCETARAQGVDLRVVPEMYQGLAWNRPVEYIGQFPTIPLHRGHIPELALLAKRFLDLVISSGTLILLSPVLLAIAAAIKFDSPGPALYCSERIGKKGRVFRCMKFRTMVHDAEKRRSEILHMNERAGVLFKITKDPRVTRLGRILRKYSLDEFPQFINVLVGDMSVVGPRPPIASEVREYELNQLRRLDVTPGITGLWQVQGRQDPSFDSYISLDLAYIENWSIWLDCKIILRTIGVVFAGTGS
jgi:exopolysaccharide biosynthesis polyprenyl glycosylphosphotransferase